MEDHVSPSLIVPREEQYVGPLGGDGFPCYWMLMV
jgi:hypothetical protein